MQFGAEAKPNVPTKPASTAEIAEIAVAEIAVDNPQIQKPDLAQKPWAEWVQRMSGMVMSHLRTPLFWNSYMLIIMRASATVLGFVFWAIAARMISTENVGLASGIMASVTLLASISQLGLGFGLVRHISQSRNVSGLLNLIFILVSGMGTISALIYLWQVPQWSPALMPIRQNPIYVVAFVLLVVGWTLSSIHNWVFIAMRKTIYTLTRQTSHMVAAVLLLLVALPFVQDFTTILVAHMLAVLISVALCFHVMPRVHPSYRFSFRLKEAYKELIGERIANYSIVSFLAEQFNRIPDSIIPLLILNMLGATTGAYFFVIWMIGRALPTWVSAVSQSLFAEGSNDPERIQEYAWKTVRLALTLCAGPMLIVFFAGKQILSVYGPEYAEQGLMLLYIVTLSSIPSILLSLFISVLRVRNELTAIVVMRVVGNGLAVICCYIGLVWMNNLNGVGVGWFASQAIMLIGALSWLYYRRQNSKVAA